MLVAGSSLNIIIYTTAFVWSSEPSPKVPWEEHFRDCLEYYEENGKWPSQSMGQLGAG